MSITATFQTDRKIMSVLSREESAVFCDSDTRGDSHRLEFHLASVESGRCVLLCSGDDVDGTMALVRLLALGFVQLAFK